MRARLGRLPKDLQLMYDELLAEIRAQPGSALTVAERAFQWVMCSFWPLKSGELVAVVCQDPDLDDVQVVDVSIDFVLLACRNLLVVDPQEETCGFSHLSVQEYFESRVWSMNVVHALVAKTCLKLLIAPLTTRSASPVEPMRGSESAEILNAGDPADNKTAAPYATMFWHEHVGNMVRTISTLA